MDSSAATAPTASRVIPPPASSVDFFDPKAGGGSQLDIVSPGLGEPMNVIISGLSSPKVLTNDGIVNFAQAIGFSNEFLDIHLGGLQTANLGDGNGAVNQTIELRQDFSNSVLGTGLESLIGGNHFRVFRQNGPKANSGALFLAVSKEENVTKGHTIVPNGYNIGRDSLVSAAVGHTSFDGVKYSTTARSITGLLQPGAQGINHDIAQDGVVTLLTVTII